MPTVTANVTGEEKRQLGILGFITGLSCRILAGQGVQMILKKNAAQIRRVDRIRKKPPEKKHARTKAT